MKFNILYAILVLPAFALTCCKDHHGDFKLENDGFLFPSAQVLNYQRYLDIELSKIADSSFNSFLAQRAAGRFAYTTSLSLFSTLSTADLAETAKSELDDLQSFNGVAHRKQLFKLIVQADQELIGLHVKASGPTGLKDANLREWVANQLPSLLNRLDHSQALWHQL